MDNKIIAPLECNVKYEDYSQLSGYTYSELARFYNNEPDTRIGATGAALTIGHAFEIALCYPEQFEEQFFVGNCGQDCPDEIYAALLAGADLRQMYKRNKDSSLNARSATLHCWLDRCLSHPGLTPITHDQHQNIWCMTHNMLRAEISGSTVEDLVTWHKSELQVALAWGGNKKGLADMLLRSDSASYLFDFKTSRTIEEFCLYLKKKYWIQACHYKEGIESITQQQCCPMVFLVATKQPPYIAYSFQFSEPLQAALNEQYKKLCYLYEQWLDDGKPTKQWEDIKILNKLWIREV